MLVGEAELLLLAPILDVEIGEVCFVKRRHSAEDNRAIVTRIVTF